MAGVFAVGDIGQAAIQCRAGEAGGVAGRAAGDVAVVGFAGDAARTRRDGDLLQEAAQQRAGVAFVDTPDGVRATRTGNVPACKGACLGEFFPGLADADTVPRECTGCRTAIVDAAALRIGGGVEAGGDLAVAVVEDVADQSADVTRARNAARGIGVADAATFVVTDQPADIIVDAGDAAGGIGVAYAFAEVVPNQPADAAGTRNAAGGIGVADHAAVVVPDQPADVHSATVQPIEYARHAARDIGVAYSAAIAVANQPADVAAARNVARDIGVVDIAAVGVPNQPADAVAALNVTRDIGVVDKAFGVVPNQPADVAAALNITRDIGVVDAAVHVAPNQPADPVPKHAAGGIHVAKSAGIVYPNQPAGVAVTGRDPAGGMGVADSA